MKRRALLKRCAQLAALALLPRALTARSRRGDLLMPPRLDAHAHLMSRDLARWLQGRIPDEPLRRLVRPINGRILVDQLEGDRIDRAFALSAAYVHATDLPLAGRRKQSRDEYRDLQNENDFTAHEAAEYSDKLIPFASVNPKRGYAVEELTRCIDTLHMDGLKVHFANSDVRLRDPAQVARVRTLFAAAAARNVPVIVHLYNDAVPGFGARDVDILVAEVIEPLPDLRISIAHLGGNGGAEEDVALRVFEALVAAVARRPGVAGRVWIDFSSVLVTNPWPPLPLTTPAQQARLAQLFTAWGVERLLWGSDGGAEALTQAQPLWPLGVSDWNTVASNDGSALLRRV
jgi:predicted TIM-barrel fold metal-dependent hydrolase